MFRFVLSVGCTDMSNELKYLCKWTTYITAHKLVSAVDAKAHFPNLIVEYLEGKLDFPPFQIANNLKNVTRAMVQSAKRENIAVDSKAKIVRNIGLEKTMLRNTAGPIIQRRNTVAAKSAKGPMTLKTIKQVPIGARG